MNAVMPTAWRLSELMARHKVQGKDLADYLGISGNALSALKNADKMPRIDGDRLDQIAAGLTELSKIGGVVRGIDLLEDRPDDADQPEPPRRSKRAQLRMNEGAITTEKVEPLPKGTRVKNAAGWIGTVIGQKDGRVVVTFDGGLVNDYPRHCLIVVQ